MYLNQGKNMSETKETQETQVTQKTRKIKCLICGQEFTSITELAKHDAQVHLKLKRKREEQVSAQK